MRVEIKRLNENVKLPTRGSEFAAGYDLYANECVTINDGETRKIGTGLQFAIPVGFFGAIFARSGLATKQGLRPSNCVGVIDAKGDDNIGFHNKMRILW